MALQLFRVQGGLSDGIVHYLSGSGAPGSSTETNAAPVGSWYSDAVTGYAYKKDIAGAGTDKWVRLPTMDDISGLGGESSWREPVEVVDDAATTLPTGTPGNPITVDGQSISNAQRVLFSAITGGAGKNIYVYDQTTATFSEDTNAETGGDRVLVLRGTFAGADFTYNGTNWVQSNQATFDELGFVRTFIGKGAAGNVTPAYTQNNYITDGDSLLVAIDTLDIELNNLQTQVTNLGTEVDAIETGAGLNADGTYTAPGGTNYIDGATSLKNADSLLDAAIGAVNNLVPTVIQTSAATSHQVGSVSVDTTAAAKWFVTIHLNSDNSRRYSCEVYATHNGTPGADANAIDYNIASILEVGTAIPDLAISAELNGAGGSQVMRLNISSSQSIFVTARRISTSATGI